MAQLMWVDILIFRALNYVRAREWMSKIVEYLLASFLFVYTLDLKESFMHNHFLLLPYQTFFYSYSYSLNDLADTEKDKKAGKQRESHKLKLSQNLLILASLAVSSIIIPFFSSNALIGSIGVLNLIFSTSYSLKPVRLKERGILGILPPTLSQRVVPFTMFALLISDHWEPITYFSAYLFLLGFCVILDHQISDYEPDKAFSTKTFAVKIGKKRAIMIRNLTFISLTIFIFSVFLLFDFHVSVMCFPVLIGYSSFCLLGRTVINRVVSIVGRKNYG